MAIKKKGAKKGGVKKKKASSKSVAAKSDLTPQTKQIFLLQVIQLEKKLQETQQKCEDALLQHRVLTEELAKTRTDNRDVYEINKREIAKRGEDIIKLREDMIKKDLASKTRIAQLEEEARSAKAALKEEQEKSRYQIDIREKKIDKLNEYKEREDQMKESLRLLRQQLVDYEGMHRSTVAQMERAAIEEREKLKKEMAAQLQSVSEAFKDEMKGALPNTTKQVIRNSRAMSMELTRLSSQVIEVIAQNDRFQDLSKQAKMQTEILEQTEVTMVKKLHAIQNALRHVQLQNDNHVEEIARLKMEAVGVERVHAEDLTRIHEAHFAELSNVNNALALLEKQLKEKGNSLEATISRSTRAEQSLSATLELLDKSISNARAAKTQRVADLPSLKELDDITLLKKYGEILENEIQTLESIKSHVLLTSSETYQPASPHRSFSLYQKGDLGLVPRPPSASSSSRPTSASPNRLRSRSIGVQTIALPFSHREIGLSLEEVDSSFEGSLFNSSSRRISFDGRNSFDGSLALSLQEEECDGDVNLNNSSHDSTSSNIPLMSSSPETKPLSKQIIREKDRPSSSHGVPRALNRSVSSPRLLPKHSSPVSNHTTTTNLPQTFVTTSSLHSRMLPPTPQPHPAPPPNNNDLSALVITPTRPKSAHPSLSGRPMIRRHSATAALPLSTRPSSASTIVVTTTQAI